jgi:hypothetical protein
MLVTYFGGPANCSRVELEGAPPATQHAEGGHYRYDGAASYHFHVGDAPAELVEPATEAESEDAQMRRATAAAARPRRRGRPRKTPQGG